MNGLVSPEEVTSLSCEVLVVGTGAGGASVAATLAGAGIDVLMLEEGPYVPADAAPTRLSDSMPRMWRGGGLTTMLGVSPIAFAEGRCVGGSTEINSAIFQRAPEDVIEGWSRSHHIADLSMKSLAPYYERAAHAVNASTTGGDTGPPTEILRRAGQGMGWKVSPIERARRESAETPHRMAGFASGTRQSMTLTLIPSALSRGARLLPRCRVNSLMRMGRRVTGVRAEAIGQDGRRHKIEVSASSVFVCAGATQTPALLQRSGFRRNVGRSLQIHPTIHVLAQFPERIDAQRHHLPMVAITEFAPNMRFGGSVFTLATFGLSLAEDWAARQSRLSGFAHHAIFYAMIRPDGVGRVRAIPGLAEPVVSYLLTERDWRRLGEGAGLLARALLAAGASHVAPSVRGHPGWSGTSELDRHPLCELPRRSSALMTIHLFGSCPMGQDEAFYPVDGSGRLREADNLFVADASILPGAPGVNPQATIMAFAFRSADMFIAKRPS